MTDSTPQSDVSSTGSASSPAYSAALLAFEQGNYKLARARAEELRSSGSNEEARAAGELLERMAPAPLARYLLLLTGVLLALVTALAYAR